ncbi:MAG: hypothetical protein ACI3YE_05530 [Candidatus Avispirillum sp.]
MPANMIALSECLDNMKKIYLDDPVTSVRGSNFIFPLHRYCIEQLISIIDPCMNVQYIPLDEMVRPRGKPHYPRTTINASGLQIMQEATLFGSHKNKDADIVLSQYANGPQIVIGVRSQMSSVAKNLENYYEGIIGECISLHDRFPMATIGYVYLLPTEPIKPGLTEEVKLDKAEALFEKITGRDDWRDSHDKYEHFAFLKVDFTQDPPTLLPTTDILRIETFFDKLIATHNDRNIFNPIITR